MSPAPAQGELGRKAAGGIFVLFWIVAIALWIIAGVALGNTGAWQPFIIDIGIVVASIGTAAPFLQTSKGFGYALLWALIAIVGFAVGDFGHITVLVYLLRIGVPFMAVLIAPLFKMANNWKVWA
jgi:hypothetical protein